MKSRLKAILILTVLTCLVVTSSVFARTENIFGTAQLLTNSGFETGDTTGWEAEGSAALAVNSSIYRSGSYSLAVSNRIAGYSACKQSIVNILNTNGSGVYYYSFYARKADGDATAVQLKTHFEYKVGTAATTQVQGSFVTLDNTWKKVEGEITTTAFNAGEITAGIVRFASNGVQNTTIYVDDFFLVKKTTAEVDDSELLTNADFENGTAGWTASCTMESVNSPTQSGNWAVLLSGRTANYMSAAQDIKTALEANGSGWYEASVYVRLAAGTPETKLRITTQIRRASTAMADNFHGSSQIVNDSEWTLLTFAEDIPWTAGGTVASIYVSTETASTASFYLDNFSLKKAADPGAGSYTPPEGELLSNGSFETGLTGWSGYSDRTFSMLQGSAYAKSGNYAVLIAARNSTAPNTEAPAQDVLTALQTAGEGDYTASVWVKKVRGQGSSDMRLMLAYNDGTEGKIIYGDAVTAGDDWAELTLSAQLPDPALWTSAKLSLDMTAAINYYADDFSLVKAVEEPEEPADPNEFLTNGGFEKGQSPWTANACTLTIVTSDVHGGTKAALVTDRSAKYSSPLYSIKDILTEKGSKKYKISTWVKLKSGEEATQMFISIQIKDGTTVEAQLAGTTAEVTDGEWTQLIFEGTIEWQNTWTTASLYIGQPDQQPISAYYADDFSMQFAPVSEEERQAGAFLNTGFEEGVTDWMSSGCELSVDMSTFRGGVFSAFAGQRTDLTDTVSHNVFDYISLLGTGNYTATAYIRTAQGQPDASFQIMVILLKDGAEVASYESAARTVSDDAWYGVRFAGEIDASADFDDAVLVIMQTDGTPVEFYIDDAQLVLTQYAAALEEPEINTPTEEPSDQDDGEEDNGGDDTPEHTGDVQLLLYGLMGLGGISALLLQNKKKR